MVKYYGRAKQRVGSVNTNQMGLKMSGCASSIGRQGLYIKYIQTRAPCNIKYCGPVYYHGVVIHINDKPCLPPQARTATLAGGVGRINAPRFKCGNRCGPLLSPPSCLQQIYGQGWQNVSLDSLNFLYLSPNCRPLLILFERRSGRVLEPKKGDEAPFPPTFQWMTNAEFTTPSEYIIPALWQPWYPLFYPMQKVCAINKYGSKTWNQLFIDNSTGCPKNRFGMVEVANHGGADGTINGKGVWWFYHAPGSGIFVDLGQSLICMNKADALHRYRIETASAAVVMPYAGTACGAPPNAPPRRLIYQFGCIS